MIHITRSQFIAQGYDTLADYDNDNRWFMFLMGGVFEKNRPADGYIAVARIAYEKVQHATADLMILGDDKIRKDPKLMRSFGLSTAESVQDGKEVLEEVRKIGIERGKMAAGGASFDPKLDKSPKLAPNNALPVADEGSILSTSGWSPMLNDAFIMSGAHANMEFFLALSADECSLWENMRVKTVAELAPKFGSTVAAPKPTASRAPMSETVQMDQDRIAQRTWLNFMRANMGMLWDDKKGIPRVFLRELIGLATFGYEPRFNKNQLGFKCVDSGRADGATLVKYVVALKKVDFQKPDKEALLQAVGTFLFSDANALGASAPTSSASAAAPSASRAPA